VTAVARHRAFLLAMAALCVAGVGIALLTQHVFDMQPCAWCVLQRLVFLCVALAALLGMPWNTALGQRCSALVMLAFSLSGIAAALWHYFVAASSSSCNRSLAERIVVGLGLDGALPEVFEARASCADATAKLLGVAYPLWSLALFVILALGAARIVLRPID
jgi:disulfide bond formation protein DsbB